MKLLYVWVEEFRNIKELGFNFSSEYKVQLNETKLEISKRLLYVNNFFGSCISDVTAIIGKNGTGKSNIIDFICTTLIKGRRNEIKEGHYVYLFEENGKFYSYERSGKSSNQFQFIDIDTNIPIEVSILKDPSIDWNCIFYSNVADGRKLKFKGNEVINLSHEENQKNQANKIKYLSYLYNKIINSNDSHISPLEEDIRFENLTFRLSFDFFEKSGNIEYELIRDRYKTAYNAKDSVSRFSYYMTATLLEYLYQYYVTNGICINAFEKLFRSLKRKKTKEGFKAENIVTLKKKVSKFFKECIEDETISNFPVNIDDFKALIELLNKLDTEAYNVPADTVEYSDKFFRIQFSEGLLKLLMEYSSIFNYNKMIVHDWDRLSSGMKAYLNLFANIYSHIDDIINENLIICIDEGDLYFHPEMQRNFLNDILQFICNQFKDKNIQIILSSHSPFLVADLPNENLILLDNRNNDNRLIIKEANANSQSFASNIYKLYNNQFFLEKGTMGEFAKNKLNEILQILNKDKITDNEIILYQKIASKIGDEVLRLKVEELLLKQTFKINKSGKEFLKNWHLQRYKELEESQND